MIILFKNIFSDILKLYKNFFHWNISKLLIFIWSLILAFISILPFVLIIFIYGYFAGLNMLELFTQVFSKTLGADMVVNLFLYIMTLIFFVIYLYGYILLIKVNFGYIKGEKLKYLKNNYFKIGKIKKYLGISFLNILILLIPILIFITVAGILVGVSVLIYGSLDDATAVINAGEINFISIISFITFIVTVIGFIYLLFRTYFSYFIFIDNKDKDLSSIGYIKKSFKKTKGIKKFLKFLLISCIFLLFLFPSRILLKVFENNITNLNNYVYYNNLTGEQKEYLLNTNSTYIQSLELEFANITSDELGSINTKNSIFMILVNIFNFLFLYGVFQMVLSSFYKHEILKK